MVKYAKEVEEETDNIINEEEVEKKKRTKVSKEVNDTEVKLVEVPTQMGIAIQIPELGTVGQEEAMVWLCNQVLKISKAVC